MTCVEKKGYFRGVVVCSWGVGGSLFRCKGGGRRRRNRGGEGRWSDHILTLLMESPIKYFHLWIHQQFYRWSGHITVRTSWFESLCNSVSKIAQKNFHIIALLCFFYSLNSVSDSLGIYQWNVSVGIYRWF